MPLKSPTSSIDSALSSLVHSPFICLACRRRRGFSSTGFPIGTLHHLQPRRRPSRSRSASTTASVTAVNAKRDIPPAFQKLHLSLKTLERDAGIYVNSSQLQLALRGVESENPVTRIAVMSLNGQNGACRLTRALLADPVASEPSWERRLTDTDADERALLLRYGERVEIEQRNPLVRTLSIPSSLLHTHKLEILIHTVGATAEPVNDGATSFLVPTLDTGDSPSGRSAMVTYPVHKALMYEEGLKSLTVFAMIDSHADQGQNGQMFKGVIDWSWSISQQANTKDTPVSPVNLALAERAIDVFRQSLQNSLEYEHLWFDAGLPNVSAWLIEGTDAQPGALKLAIRRLIQSICNTAYEALRREEVASLAQEKAETVPLADKKSIDQGITIWAENAHTELRDRLNVAFNSKSWRKTKWWKLFWRVDDVGYIASDILQRTWLVEAEKEIIWISGRIHQSGLLGPRKLSPMLVPNPDKGHTLPWPQHISDARSVLSRLTIPPLQSLSQALLLQTLSTNVLTSSLSALLYVSVSTTSPYEAGAIAAVGLVYSLRRLQKRWESARTKWERQIREEGRKVLRIAEENARVVVQEGRVPAVDEVGKYERQIAREAVHRVESALGEVKG